MPFPNVRDMASAGLRPAGTGPSTMETIITGGKEFLNAYFEEEEKRNKKAKDNLDMYVTLRKAGYSSDQATDAVRKGKLPFGAPEQDTYAAEAEETMLKPAKTRAEISKTEAYAKSYAGGGGYESSEDVPEISGGLPLKKVYQDKKTGKWYGEYGHGRAKTADELAAEQMAGWEKEAETETKTKKTEPKDTRNILQKIIDKFRGPAELPTQESTPVKSTEPKVSTKAEEYVNVYDPNGKPGKVKSSQLQKALKAGYRKR